MVALNEYVPGSRLLAGGRIYASHGLIRSFEKDGGGFGLTRYRFECTHGHVFYEMHTGVTQCRTCSAPLRSGKGSLVIRASYSSTLNVVRARNFRIVLYARAASW
jgi:hypothetical protein